MLVWGPRKKTEVVNQTSVTEFIIMGFPSLERLYSLFFFVFLFIYLFTVSGNTLIFLTVRANHHLHTPMFYFLIHLSLMEIWYTSVIIPKMLANFVTKTGHISFLNCMMQLYLFSSLSASECYLLTLMGYDRYLAICKPLHYNRLMMPGNCLQLAATSWVCGFLSPILPVSLISQLSFCGPNMVNYFYCDAQPLLKLSCTNTHITAAAISLLASTLILSSFLLTMVSYAFIISTILRIPSGLGRQKAFSTCSSHLVVVMIYYGTIVCLYIQPTASVSMDLNKVFSLLYTVVTPMLNPIIYSLRNREMKESLKKLLRRKLTF
ncbi:olfactory receptor 6N1-like [Ambystoma mexicanum]|uniref:olfactory receptor 6N1-like n=1 Tax=Ambystoma mexicanum TaxID=8296 RepID=UPI0037E8CAC4